MTLSPAQKQARYREKNIVQGDRRRMQVVVCSHAKRALERLARHNGLTLGAMVERLANEEASRVCRPMSESEYRTFVGE